MTSKAPTPLTLDPTPAEVAANAAIPCAHCGEPVGKVAGMFAMSCGTCDKAIHFRCGVVKDETGRNQLYCNQG